MFHLKSSGLAEQNGSKAQDTLYDLTEVNSEKSDTALNTIGEP